MNKIKYFFIWILGKCPHCNAYLKYPKKYDRHTLYEESYKNVGYACKECQKQDHEIVDGLWKDYYNSIL